MPRSMFVLALSVVLVPGRLVLAGPPEGVSGRMTFDPITAGLLPYRTEKRVERRISLLRRLAPSRDPRVALVLAQAALDLEEREVSWEATMLLCWHYMHPEMGPQAVAYHPASHEAYRNEVRVWWHHSERDTRGRAKQLP